MRVLLHTLVQHASHRTYTILRFHRGKILRYLSMCITFPFCKVWYAFIVLYTKLTTKMKHIRIAYEMKFLKWFVFIKHCYHRLSKAKRHPRSNMELRKCLQRMPEIIYQSFGISFIFFSFCSIQWAPVCKNTAFESACKFAFFFFI